MLLLSLGRGRLKCDDTRAETRFLLSAKRTSPFKWAGASVQSTAGSRGVRTSGSNAGYTMFRGSVKSTGYPLHSPVSPSLPFPCVTVCHQSHFNWSLLAYRPTATVTFLFTILESDRLFVSWFCVSSSTENAATCASARSYLHPRFL